MFSNLLGLTLSTTRDHIYRVALEGLSYQLRLAIEIIERAFKVKTKSVRVVGGESKNVLWNQIRTDVTNLPILVSRFSEVTVLGVALVAFVRVGVFKSAEDALKSLDWGLKRSIPASLVTYMSATMKCTKGVLRALKQYHERWV